MQLVLSGEIYVPANVLHASAASPKEIEFTPRQMEVLELLLKGMPNKVICRELDLSVNTVKSHLGEIFSKLQVSNRVQAVIEANRRRIRILSGPRTPRPKPRLRTACEYLTSLIPHLQDAMPCGLA